MSAGTAHVFYPEATDERCTVALLLEVDPVALVRGRSATAATPFALGQYVNDRPYAASSMLAVALGKVFRTAMAGRCDARPELVDQALPLEVRVPALPTPRRRRAGRASCSSRWAGRSRRPPLPLDETVPAWGDSRYVDLRLTGDAARSPTR